MVKTIFLKKSVLDVNNKAAMANRRFFEEQKALVFNVLGSPGAGKTSWLEKTFDCLQGVIKAGVIEGDIYTSRDAKRIERLGIPVVQLNTGGACHLDAAMVAAALKDLDVGPFKLLFIENVGNLVCPAEFDLGETAKIVVLSVTEGNDKPVKYPVVFRHAAVVVLTKIDLIPYTDFSIDLLRQDLLNINPELALFPLSAKTGEGFNEWVGWLNWLVGEKENEDSKNSS